MKFKIYSIAFFIFSAFLFENSEGIKPTVGTVTESVYASGIIKADNQYTVYSTVNGILQKKSYCRTTHKSRAAAFELESEKPN
jgi:multidrug efflux pump subunit AcrA (membrane-fusion protein)